MHSIIGVDPPLQDFSGSQIRQPGPGPGCPPPGYATGFTPPNYLQRIYVHGDSQLVVHNVELLDTGVRTDILGREFLRIWIM